MSTEFNTYTKANIISKTEFIANCRYSLENPGNALTTLFTLLANNMIDVEKFKEELLNFIKISLDEDTNSQLRASQLYNTEFIKKLLVLDDHFRNYSNNLFTV